MITTEWLTTNQIAALPGMPSERSIIRRADRENWAKRKRASGKGFEYHVRNLPKAARVHIETGAAPSGSRCNDKSPVVTGTSSAGGVVSESVTINRQSARSRATGTFSEVAEARLSVLLLIDDFARASGLSATHALNEFCARYRAGDVSVPAQIRDLIPDVAPASIYRWRCKLRGGGIQALGDNYGNRKGSGKIDSQSELKEWVLAFITQFPHTSAAGLCDKIQFRFSDRDDIDLPGESAVARWLNKFKKNNKQLFASIANPDDWKNKYQVAFGSRSEGITALNQLWELDSTPADVMLIDGRHSIIGCIDVWPRRPKLLVSKTSKAAAIVSLNRRCLIDWGVPEKVKTDNGQDYKSKHVRGTYAALGVEQEFCLPFTPEDKPHIERLFHSWAHDLVEYMPGFIGHNVSERKAIEARKTFAQRIMRPGEVVEIAMTSEQLQEACDIWCDNIYMHREHSGLNNQTPFNRVANWAGPVRRIENERALDIALLEDFTATIGKKGIRKDNCAYISDKLFNGVVDVGDAVACKRDPEDVGRIYVFGGDPLQFMCVAEDPEITGISRREVAIRAKRKQQQNRAEATRYLKQLSRNNNVKDIAKEILQDAVDKHAVQLFPRAGNAHTTDSLTVAADAARAFDVPSQNVLVSDEEIELLQRAEDKPYVVQSDDPLRRYSRWCRIEQRITNGEYIAPVDREGLKSYQLSAEYASMRKLHEDFGDDMLAEAE